MIVEAERMSNAQQNKPYYKRCDSEKNNEDSHRISSWRTRKHFKSRSRSRDRAGRYDTPEYSSQQHCTELKRTYRKPKDNDDYQQIVPASSRIKNWKKDKSDERRGEVTEFYASEVKEGDSGNIYNTNETSEGDDVGVFTEAEMNKLGARIIKAELTGDDVCSLFH